MELRGGGRIRALKERYDLVDTAKIPRRKYKYERVEPVTYSFHSKHHFNNNIDNSCR